MDKVLRSMKSNFFVDSFHNSYHYDDHNTFFSYFHEHPYERGQPLSFLNSSEKAYLIELVDDFGKNNLDVNWNMVADKLNGYKASSRILQPMECLMAYRNILDPKLNFEPWTSEEEIHLLEIINTKYSCHNWSAISNELGTNRTPLSCLKHYQQTLNIKHINSSLWGEEELKTLEQAVELYGEENWEHVSNSIPGRTSCQCNLRWIKLKTDRQATSTGDWTVQEERLLFLAAIAYQLPSVNDNKKSIDLSVLKQTANNNNNNNNGEESEQDIESIGADVDNNDAVTGEAGSTVTSTWTWQNVANLIPGRSAMSCREKWCNRMDPFLNRGPFTAEEDELLVFLAEKDPERHWAKMSRYVYGRTDEMVSSRITKLLGDPHKDMRSYSKRLLPRKYRRKRADAKIRPEDFSSVLRVSVPSVGNFYGGSDDDHDISGEDAACS